MRTIIDIPESQVVIMAEICNEKHISRAALIREAIQYYIENECIQEQKQEYFGMWKSKAVDSLSYQEKLRDEWQ